MGLSANRIAVLNMIFFKLRKFPNTYYYLSCKVLEYTMNGQDVVAKYTYFLSNQ